MMIHIQNYPVFLKLGHYDHERTVAQNALVSLEVELFDETGPGMSDELQETINYGEIIALLDEVVVGREIKLVETVVEMIGKSLLQHFPLAKSASVEVEKRVLPQELVKGAKISVAKKFTRTPL